MRGRGSGLTACRRAAGTSCATSDPSRARRRSRGRWPRRVGGVCLGRVWRCSPRSFLRSATQHWRPYSSVASVRLGFERLHPHAQAGASEAPLGTNLEGGNLVASRHPVDVSRSMCSSSATSSGVRTSGSSGGTVAVARCWPRWLVARFACEAGRTPSLSRSCPGLARRLRAVLGASGKRPWTGRNTASGSRRV
jgi:hypothetical protein